MENPFIESLIGLVVRLSGFEVGAPGFSIIIASFLVAATLVVRLLSGAFGSEKGILICGLAVAIVAMAGLAGYAATEVFVMPSLSEVQLRWLPSAGPWIGMGLVTLLSVLLIASRMIAMSALGMCFIFLLAGAAGIGTCYAAGMFVDMAETSQDVREESGDRLERNLEGLED